MLPLIQMTQEQIESYRPIWRRFRSIGYIFGAPYRTFAFLGGLDVSEDGRIALEALLVTCSREHVLEELRGEITTLRRSIGESGWSITRADESRIEGERATFQLTLVSEPTPDETTATHLFLSYGDTNELRDTYQTSIFLLGSDYDRPSKPLPSRFYPVGADAAPEKAESVSVDEVVRRVRGKTIVAFTGAGISLSSGIPTFRGPGGLDEHFPLHEPFPGEVADWMIRRPRELVELLARFQAAFITARPNAAHCALAELERMGTLAHLLTGNDDGLHERAGNQRVHLKHARHFVESDEGWAWIREGESLLVIGVSRDEHGLISYARDHGIRIVAVAPERPSFLHEEDAFLQGNAEEVLSELVDCLKRVANAG